MGPMHRLHRPHSMPPVEIRQLESFVALADLLHFGRAAERVHLSQPALSRQIQGLERELGTVLFDRGRTGVTLTSAGRTLQQHARRVLDDLDALRASLASADSLQGHLSLACFDSASAYLVPELLTQLDASHPGLQLSVATLGTRDALRQLREGGVDAAIVTLPVDAQEFRVVPLYRERLVAVVPRGHALARQRTVGIEALCAERLITFLAGQNNTRLVIDAAFDAVGHHPGSVIELASVQAIKDAVRAGLGVAILGEMSLSKRAHDAGLIAHPLAPALHRDVALVTRAVRRDNALLLPLIRAIRTAAEALRLAPALT